MLALVCLPLCAPQPQAGTALLPLPLALAPLALLAMAAVAPAVASMRKPPLGFSSWNNVGMEVSAPMLLEVADAMTSSGGCARQNTSTSTQTMAGTHRNGTPREVYNLAATSQIRRWKT